MRLLKVEYEFFDFEEPSELAPELHRQIRLHFSDAPTLYLSWTWERQYGPDSEPYSMGCRESSFFNDEPAAVVDASNSSLWSRLLGREVEVAYEPTTSQLFEYQVLKIGPGEDCTFVYSLGLDRLRVSDQSPMRRGRVDITEPRSSRTI